MRLRKSDEGDDLRLECNAGRVCNARRVCNPSTVCNAGKVCNADGVCNPKDNPDGGITQVDHLL
ncbi:hypothetical protein DL95DRAFT_398650, partial [Leptodontidium sp. 2 PMI_412]